MASTRNNNTPGNYCLQQRSYDESRNYLINANSPHAAAHCTRLPGNGLLPGQVPWTQLSYNAVDIESFLYGINPTNLVKPEPCLTPELKKLEMANIFKTEPTYIPEPLVIQKGQRPFPVPN